MAKPREMGVMRHSCRFPIYYEDTDFSGFVYHANYLKFFERAREQVIGIRYLKELYEQGLHFVVSRAELRYRAPARHGDLVEITTEGRFSRSPVMTFEQSAWLAMDDGSRALLVEATIVAAALGPAGRPVRLPGHVLEHFARRAERLTTEAAPERGDDALT